MRSVYLFVFAYFLHATAGFTQTALTGESAALYQQANEQGRFKNEAKAIPATLHATSDQKSYFLVWTPLASQRPSHWIVSLHGTGGYATDDLALWYPHIKNRDIGLICLQWWLGQDSPNYYPPMLIYREVDRALELAGATPGRVMFHGFSRGSANSYPVAAIDQGKGKHYFSLIVASSGGVSEDYPPVQNLIRGMFGEKPLLNTHWITVAGAKDPHPDRDGIPGMQRTATWLKAQGAVVDLAIEDPSNGHGALMRNADNVEQVLGRFLKE